MYRLLIIGLLGFLLIGCSAKQVQRFAQAVNQAAATGDFSPVLRRAVNWTVENFAHTALGAGIPIRDKDNGPILGRWFITHLRFQETREGNLIAEIAGEGYRHGQFSGVVTFQSSAKVLYRADMQPIEGDNVLITFTPLKIYEVAAGVVRGGLLAQLGDLFDVFRQKMEEKLRRGFTVSFNSRLEKQTYLGLGQPRELPPKPWIPPEGAQALLNDRISLCERSRHFLGPFRVRQGETLQWAFEVDAGHEGDLNAYVLADADARAMRDAYIDTRRPLKKTYPTYASKKKFRSCQESLPCSGDGVVWLLVDPEHLRGEMHVKTFVGTTR